MRLTLDIDNCSERRIKNLAKLLNLMFPGKTVRLDSSASGKGYHIFVYSIECDYATLMKLRRMLGDDELRMEHDNRRKGNAPTQVMFTKKRGGSARTLLIINDREGIPHLR